MQIKIKFILSVKIEMFENEFTIYKSILIIFDYWFDNEYTFFLNNQRDTNTIIIINKNKLIMC